MGGCTHSNSMPFQLEDEVFILAVQVVLNILRQQQGLTEALYNLSPQAIPPSSDIRVIGEGFVTQHEGALPS